MMCVSFPSVACALSRSRSGFNVAISGINNLCCHRQIRKRRSLHQCANFLRHSIPYNGTLQNRTSSWLMNNHVMDVEKFVLAKKKFSTKTPTSSSSLLSKNIAVDSNAAPEEIPTSQSSSLFGSTSDSESFEVIKIVTETGKIETIQMLLAEIIEQTKLLPRDLVSLRLTSKKERKENWIGNTLIEQMRHPPTIMARNDFILLSLGPVRAVAERDVIYVFDVHNKPALSFTKHLSEVFQRRTKRMKGENVSLFKRTKETQYEEPTELVFLETVLADAISSFSSRVRIFEPIVNDLLLRISTDEHTDANLVHQMVPLMEQLQSFEIYVAQAYDSLMQLLNDDEAMLQLLLTEQEEARKANTSVDFERHQHVENILGIYARRLSSIMQETKYLLGRIKNKQDFVELEIDLYRNRMIRMNIDLTILATATGVTTALSGTFGMNMVNGFEESHTAFLVVSAASALTALSVAYYFRRMVSGRVIQQRAEQRINEIRTMSNALSDMTALDYTVKKMMRGTSMGREEFKQQLLMARQCKKRCSDKEIDLLFNVLNTDEDNVLSKDDFPDKRTMYGGKK